jgi:endopeptidase La
MNPEQLLIDSIKIISLNNIEKLFSTLPYDIITSSKEISVLLDILEQDYQRLIKNKNKKNRRNMKFDELETEEDYNCFVCNIHLDVLNNIKLANSSSKYKLNIMDFIRKEKRKLTMRSNKIHNISITRSPVSKHSKHSNPAKRSKKDSIISKDYDDDDEDDDSDSDYDDNEYDDECDDYDEYDPSDRHGGGGGGNDDDMSDNSKKRKQPSKTSKMSVKGSNYISQLYRGKDCGRMEDDTIRHYMDMSEKEQTDTYDKLKSINEYQNTDQPILFKIANLDLPLDQKNHVMKNYIVATTSRGEQKMKQWVDNFMQIPFGSYKGTNLTSIKPKKVKTFINKLQEQMDKAVFGHDEAKRLIIQVMGQQIRNPTGKASILAIYGCMGNGKTSLVKEGIAKAMDKPFVYISLGGATDASFLEGHSYTYEGSICGRIVNGLIASKCMDPIIYFDELDKISKTHKGDEITNILVHLTDPVQNSHFRDRYFNGVDIDLSRATMIFSFNDPSNVNPILLDRITTVETKHLLPSQKVHIATNYLCPVMFKEMGLPENAISFSDEIIRDLIDKYTCEGGVRKLKALLYNIARELNLANLTSEKVDGDSVSFPFQIKLSHIKHLLKNKMEIEPEKIHKEPKVGVINGLYATSSGSYGGVLPIEILWTPTSSPLEFKTTGNLEKVIKESTQVASTLAFNRLNVDVRNKLLKDLKENPQGFHIHMADGSTSKDGPSAGTALTVALYSMMTNTKIRNDIAITGEITLQGNVTAIGGLDNKLEGAKKAGVKLVLCPLENEKHLIKIKERNPTLIDDNFKVVTIETIEEALKYSLIDARPYN